MGISAQSGFYPVLFLLGFLPVLLFAYLENKKCAVWLVRRNLVVPP